LSDYPHQGEHQRTGPSHCMGVAGGAGTSCGSMSRATRRSVVLLCSLGPRRHRGRGPDHGAHAAGCLPPRHRRQGV